MPILEVVVAVFVSMLLYGFVGGVLTGLFFRNLDTGDSVACVAFWPVAIPVLLAGRMAQFGYSVAERVVTDLEQARALTTTTPEEVCDYYNCPHEAAKHRKAHRALPLA